MKTSKTRNTNVKMLAKDPETAIMQLARLTRDLVNFSEAETGALVRNDMIRLAAIQDDKEKLAHQYAKASMEFRARIAEFRGIDKKVIGELESWQTQLARKSEENNTLMARVRARSYGSHATLLVAQEMGQNNRTPANTGHKGA
jgi:hypothetical protein